MESETKIEVTDFGPVRERLRGLGAVCLGAVDEKNLYLDQAGELRARGESLRIRRDARVRVTWKGPSRFKDGVVERPEIEIEVNDDAEALALFTRLGYRVTEQLAKRRETWRMPDAEVALDTLAFGRFVEIEGPTELVPRLARALGLDPARGIPVSYRQLQRDRDRNTR